MKTSALSKRVLNWIIFSIIFILLCGFQSSFWPFIVSFLPSPPLWIILCVFITMKFSLYEGLFFSYFLGLILTRFSILPLKTIWISFNLMYVITWTIKSRLRSSGLKAFGLLCVLAHFMFTVLQYILSQLLEPIPTRLYIIEPLLQAGLVFIFSIPLYLFFDFIDQKISVRQQWSDDAHAKQDEWS